MIGTYRKAGGINPAGLWCSSIRPLLGLFSFPLCDRLRMIRDLLHFRLINRHCTVGLREGCASRNDPLLRTRRAGVSGASLDATWVNVLLCFAARDVSLHVERALSRQVLTFFGWTRVANNDQLGVRILLQLECNIVQFGLAGVIDTPG